MQQWHRHHPDFHIEAISCHVWALSLDQANADYPALWEILADNEKQRADTLRLAAAKRQFVLTRGTLRTLLGLYLDIAPNDCRFARSEFGKPCLRAPARDLRFNVAHSGTQALIAIAQGADVGVDIEIQRTLDDLEAVARMILSPSEWECWQTLTEPERTSAFYAIWTHKEAITKASGQGLLREPSTVELSLGPGRPVKLLRIPGWANPQSWTVNELDAPPGYSAALASPASGLRVVQRRLEPGTAGLRH
jgi:4'-phosphopantetheinyl transferase